MGQSARQGSPGYGGLENAKPLLRNSYRGELELSQEDGHRLGRLPQQAERQQQPLRQKASKGFRAPEYGLRQREQKGAYDDGPPVSQTTPQGTSRARAVRRQALSITPICSRSRPAA